MSDWTGYFLTGWGASRACMRYTCMIHLLVTQDIHVNMQSASSSVLFLFFPLSHRQSEQWQWRWKKKHFAPLVLTFLIYIHFLVSAAAFLVSLSLFNYWRTRNREWHIHLQVNMLQDKTRQDETTCVHNVFSMVCDIMDTGCTRETRETSDTSFRGNGVMYSCLWHLTWE